MNNLQKATMLLHNNSVYGLPSSEQFMLESDYDILLRLSQTFGYWSDEVLEFNSNLDYSTRVDINNKYLATKSNNNENSNLQTN